MRYLCLIYWNEHELATLPLDRLNRLNAAHLAFNEQIRATGHLVEAEALQPSRASKCVRVRQGKVSVTDGPFTEAKEVVGGFSFLDVRSLEEATELGARLMQLHVEHWPGWEGELEVRPVFGPGDKSG